MLKSKSIEICYKCGSRITDPDRTIDHLPPKSCVPDKFKGKVIRVVSCKICNNGRASDDEYFQHWLVTGASSMSEMAKPIYLDKVRASMRNPAKRNTIKNMIQSRQFSTSSGIYLGQTPVLIGDENKINSVLDSIGKATIYHHFHARNLPLPFEVVPFYIQNPDLDNELIRFMLDNSVYVNKIPKIFEYRFGHRSVDGGAIFPIFLIFYQSVVFHLHYLLDNKIVSASGA